MDKYIMYQTNKTVGIVHNKERNKFQFDKELSPIRTVITNVSEQAIETLMNMYTQDIELFVEVIQEELNSNFLTTYMS